jgi:hypothetical protein
MILRPSWGKAVHYFLRPVPEATPAGFSSSAFGVYFQREVLAYLINEYLIKIHDASRGRKARKKFPLEKHFCKATRK